MEADRKRRQIIPPGDTREILPRRMIIRGRKNFVYILRQGRKIEGSLLSCFVASLPETSRENNGFTFAVIVQRSAGSAVFRNKIKRWVREAFRRNKKLLTVVEGRTVGSTAILFRYRRTKLVEMIRYADIERDVLKMLENIIHIKD